jgi:hypothetical protein
MRSFVPPVRHAWVHLRGFMSRFQLAIGLALIVIPFSGPHAQQAPATPAASTASGAYRSAFQGYRTFSEQPVAPWRQSNDTVREIGGWRAYAREAQAGASASAPAASPAASSASSPHAGHH